MEVRDDDARTVLSVFLNFKTYKWLFGVMLREAPLQLHSMVHGLRWDRDRNRRHEASGQHQKTDFRRVLMWRTPVLFLWWPPV